jgi:FKBP-type peptidyl-prolyl cis-trans isomerase FklB
MKSYLIPMLALGLLVGCSNAPDKPDLTNPKQKASYAIGVNVASTLKAQGLDLDAKALTAGINDTLAGTLALSQQDLTDTLTKLQQEMMARANAQSKIDGDANLKAGMDFLAANAKKDGVKTTASGLQYKVITSGTGASPTKTDTVKVHYQGTLIDGTVFDSSVQRGQPITFPIVNVIPGWTEALQMMKVGDKWQLFIPANLAYGAQSPPGSRIGPNSTLIFEVELLGVEKPSDAAATPSTNATPPANR